jgi:hypothetical protein
MTRGTRIALVTVGLAATGAGVGGACAAVTLALISTLEFLFGGLALASLDAFVLSHAGLVGAVIGGVAAPAVGWGLLRRVPLGRAIVHTAVGTVLGAVTGWWLPVVGPIYGALVGFGTAAAGLWHATPAGPDQSVRSPAAYLEMPGPSTRD